MRVASLLVSVVLAASGMACGGDDDGDERAGTAGSTAATTTAASPPTTLTPEEAAEATYLELVEVVYRLLTTNPDPDDPDLARLATEPVLSSLRDNLETMRTENHIVERGDQTRQDVIDIAVAADGTATMIACSVGNDATIDADDGSTIARPDLSARRLEVTLVHGADASWQVSDIGTLDIYAGMTSCPS